MKDFKIIEIMELFDEGEVTTADKIDPTKTPILTSLKFSVLFTKAKFPTNRLIVNPIPVRTPTP